MRQERVQVRWQGLRPPVKLFSKGDLVKLVNAGLVKTFADAVGLGMLGLGPGAINLVETQEALVLMAVIPATVLSAPIRQHPQHQNGVCLEKGQTWSFNVSAAVTGVLVLCPLQRPGKSKGQSRSVD